MATVSLQELIARVEKLESFVTGQYAVAAEYYGVVAPAADETAQTVEVNL